MNQNMINKINRMKKDMERTQQELDANVYTGTAGGLVTVSAKGTKEIVSITINEDLANIEDKEMLEDAIVAAINKTFNAIDKEIEEQMGKFTEGLPGFPGLF